MANIHVNRSSIGVIRCLDIEALVDISVGMDGHSGGGGRWWRRWHNIAFNAIGECKQALRINRILDALKTGIMRAVIAELPYTMLSVSRHGNLV